MKASRRTALSVTAAGLIHVAANPLSVLGQQPASPEMLIRQAAERGHTDLEWLKSDHGIFLRQQFAGKSFLTSRS